VGTETLADNTDLTRRGHSATEDCLRQAIDSVSEGLALFDADDRLVLTNRRFRDIYGGVAGPFVPGTEFAGVMRGIAELGVVAEVRNRVEGWVRERLAGHRTVGSRFEHRLGLDRWLTVDVRETGDGGTVMLVADATEAKSDTETLRQLSRAIEQSPCVIIITDTNGIIEYVNPRFTEVSGYSAAEVHGRTPAILKSGATSPETYDSLWHALRAGREWRGEIMNRRGDGSYYWCRETLSPIRDGSGTVTHFLAIEEDITDLKDVESRLEQARKSELTGRLAGSIAHDFNNILQIIAGFTELALRDQPADTTATGYLETALRSVERGRDFAKQLLTVSGRVEPKKVELSLAGLLGDCMEMLRQTLPRGLVIEDRVTGGLGPVLADPAQVQQVIVNLCANAAEAMGLGGTLSVTLERVALDGNMPVVGGTLAGGRYLKLGVTDTGMGMDAATRAQMFEPYFTTKQVTVGSGLGLAVVQGIVAEHSGGITVESGVGKGTKVSVFLPEIAGVVAPSAAAHSGRTLGGSERILFVDDEEAVAESCAALLTREGYSVVTTLSGAEALAIFREQAGNFDLVITDQAMANMTGDALARKLLEIRPETSIMLCTGYSDTIDAAQAKAMGIAGFLMKPAVGAALLEAVRDVLDAADGVRPGRPALRLVRPGESR
jgi:PAS domain S-box-containing protein